MSNKKTLKKKPQKKGSTQSKATRRKSTKEKIVKPKKKRVSTKKNTSKAMKEFWKEILLTTVIVSFLFMILSLTIFTLPKVEGYGMTPVLNNGERVFVNRLGTIRRFKLIYFKVPNSHETSIRRVIGLPNEHIQYKNDQLYINHQETVERFLQNQLNHAKQNEELVTDDFQLQQLPDVKYDTIPRGKYLVLGDNRPYSTDSRYYGLVDEKDIIGTVEMRILPLHQLVSF
ncbi:signal peptidase I [Enterococcus termitis]|nr:signal peptidase I [Enterococcus termitis]